MGGGGDGGFAAAAAKEEAKKQAARDALNLQFGVAPSSSANIDRSLYTIPATTTGTTGTDGGEMQITPGYFDQAAYDAAVAAANGGMSSEAAKNKAAREALYGTVRDNAFTAGKRRLDESRGDAERNNRFALFAQGLNGGSVDIDENALLGRTYNQGTLDLGAKADATAADLRGNDEMTRLGLLQSIDAGMDQGSALSSSLAQLQVNSDKAAAEGQGTALGDLFGTSGLLYTKSEAARGNSKAKDDFYGQYGYPGSRTSKGGSSGGNISWAG